jgi:hypothetical protein
MKIYANLMGEWVKLDNYNDLINGDPSADFVEEKLLNNKNADGFVKLRCSDSLYHIHLSCIQWTM